MSSADRLMLRFITLAVFAVLSIGVMTKAKVIVDDLKSVIREVFDEINITTNL